MADEKTKRAKKLNYEPYEMKGVGQVVDFPVTVTVPDEVITRLMVARKATRTGVVQSFRDAVSEVIIAESDILERVAADLTPVEAPTETQTEAAPLTAPAT